MKIIKTYIVQFILSIVFVFSMLFFFNSQSAPTLDQNIKDFNSHWKVQINSESMSELTLEKTLPTNIENGDAIIFFTSHHQVQVFLDHNMVYEFALRDNCNSKTPGNAWHIIRLEKEDAGKSMKVIASPSYKSVAGYTPLFKYGKSEALVGEVFRSKILSLSSSMILLVVGIFGIAGSIFFHKQLDLVNSFIWIGLFSFAMAVWSLSDSDIIPLFLGHHLMVNRISLISLKLLLIPIVKYVQSIYSLEDNKFTRVLCGLSIFDFFATSTLQVFGILDLKETLIFTHFLMIIAAVTIAIINIKTLLTARKRLRKIVQIHLVSIIFLAILACVDLFRYSVSSVSYTKNTGGFIKFGLVAYILILLYLAVNNAVKLIHSKEQLDSIKEYSKRDALTQLGNRIAFQEEVDTIFYAKDYTKYSIVIFDLNNLKEFNDHYGHSTGDYYIIISSEIIQDLFGKYGKVYRIGGDEFCAILKNLSCVEFTKLEERMGKRMEELKGIFLDLRMSIAAGYASYDPGKDLSINDTLQRADENMYEHKKKMKKVSESFKTEKV